MKLSLTNYIGISVVGISIINLIILLTVSLDYAKITHATCASPYCTLLNHIPIQSFAGFSLLLLLAGLGGYLIVQPREIEKIQTVSKAKINRMVQSLQSEERKIFDEIAKTDGSIFQNDLIFKTGFSKVKVSRVLDRLEAKGLVERRRRGMSNMVISKI